MERWVIGTIVGYFAYILFISAVTSGSNYKAFDLTAEQQEILQNPSGDAWTILNKMLVLGSVSPAYAIMNGISTILTIVFIIALAVAINEFIPFT